ncbi:D-alanyl-D-alanine carboxypeptidase/D-alanyl-D-alanine-endopeptidase [Hyphomonas sp.]|uniref:D-alanyl-D-alanine carboxypeptidase/D-alanyl-D-alanine endopeptidase n=1 Tax=Hyphomonas sp. TaxID=87 RepID=UPI00391C0ECC
MIALKRNGLAYLLLAALGFLIAACATVPQAEDLPGPFEAMPGEGVRWGAVVTTLTGETLVALRADERFIPASNTKLFTTAAAFHYLGDPEVPDPASGTSLWLVPPAEGGGAPSLLLKGAGDASLTDGPDCLENCLHQLADAVAAAGITTISDVIADDSFLPASLWGQGWSWNNFVWYYTAPVSSLPVNENTLGLRLRPGEAPEDPVQAEWLPGDEGFLTLQNEAVTGASGADQTLRFERTPGRDTLRLTGLVPQDAAPRVYALAVADPPRAAATRLIRLLRARGVTVEGEALTHREAPLADISATELARLDAPPLIHSIRRVQRDSQNLHAELLLRRIALASGELSPEGGPEILRALIISAGLSPVEAELFDGSGLSTYNRVTPAGMARFLRWAAAQDWGDAWRATLPAGGADGTLTRRFRGTILEGRIFAKTGSLHGVNALSGYMISASGQALVFSVFANDRPNDAPSIIAAMDAELVRIASEN